MYVTFQYIMIKVSNIQSRQLLLMTLIFVGIFYRVPGTDRYALYLFQPI
jgi:hypothetical protein